MCTSTPTQIGGFESTGRFPRPKPALRDTQPKLHRRTSPPPYRLIPIDIPPKENQRRLCQTELDPRRRSPPDSRIYVEPTLKAVPTPRKDRARSPTRRPPGRREETRRSRTYSPHEKRPRLHLEKVPPVLRDLLVGDQDPVTVFTKLDIDCRDDDSGCASSLSTSRPGTSTDIEEPMQMDSGIVEEPPS